MLQREGITDGVHQKDVETVCQLVYRVNSLHSKAHPDSDAFGRRLEKEFWWGNNHTHHTLWLAEINMRVFPGQIIRRMIDIMLRQHLASPLKPVNPSKYCLPQAVRVTSLHSEKALHGGTRSKVFQLTSDAQSQLYCGSLDDVLHFVLGQPECLDMKLWSPIWRGICVDEGVYERYYDAMQGDNPFGAQSGAAGPPGAAASAAGGETKHPTCSGTDSFSMHPSQQMAFEPGRTQSIIFPVRSLNKRKTRWWRGSILIEVLDFVPTELPPEPVESEDDPEEEQLDFSQLIPDFIPHLVWQLRQSCLDGMRGLKCRGAVQCSKGEGKLA